MVEWRVTIDTFDSIENKTYISFGSQITEMERELYNLMVYC